LDLATALDGQRPVAIEFQFVEPVLSLGKPLGAQEQHRRDEFGVDIWT
jgi:hypothetical protein